MKLTRREFELATLAALTAPATTMTLRATALAQQSPPAKEVPWLAEIQTRPANLPADAPRLPPLLGEVGGQILSKEQWNEHRQRLRRAWLDLLGMWSPPQVPPQYEILESQRTPTVIRQLVRYESERAVPVEAYVLKPNKIDGRRPAVVVLHSTVDYTIRQPAGLEGPASAFWGLKLAERGMVVVCPRCFLWDTLPANYAQRVKVVQHRRPNARGMAKMLYDAQRAVDLLVTLDEVDPRRIGVAGHSLGAKEALYLAAFDERVKVAVSSEGGIGTTFSNWHDPWYLGTKPWQREHHELLGLIAPRPFLLIGGDSADGARSWPFIEAAMSVYRLYGQPGRIGLYNHRQGHYIPPVAEQRVYEWLQTYL